MMEIAEQKVAQADIFITIGTSLNVYTATSLVHCIAKHTQCFLIDPRIPNYSFSKNWSLIQATAAEGLKSIEKALKKEKEA